MTPIALRVVRALARRRIVVDSVGVADSGGFDLIKFHKDGREREIRVWRGPVPDEDAFLGKLMEEIDE